MLHAICHFGSSNLRLAVEPKRQIELLLLLRRYLLRLTMLMAIVHALCARIGPPWQLQHTWIGARSCAASMSFAMAARSCCTAAMLLRFNTFPRTLTGYPSCQVSSRRCGSQRVWPRTALAVRRGGVGFSSRGSGPLPDGMCWWRLVCPRRRHGLESVLAQPTCHRRRCVGPLPALRSTMWRRVMSTGWWPHWRKSGVMVFGECGGPGNRASGAGLGSLEAGLENYILLVHSYSAPVPHVPPLCVLRLYQAMPSLPPLVGWGLVCWWRVWFGPRRSQCSSMKATGMRARTWPPPLPRRYKPVPLHGTRLGRALHRP